MAGVVLYKFGNEVIQRVFKAEVNLKAFEESYLDVYDTVGYQINICLNSDCSSRFPFPALVSHSFDGADFYHLGCNKTIYDRFAGGGTLKNQNGFQKIPQPCSPPHNAKCKLVITDENNNRLFYAVGACPVYFAVSNGSNCGEGFLELKKSSYPGYCCISCSELKGSISSLKNDVRRLADG